ncbi:S-adenosyl-l-methionine hydroxide adenosyltransferase family protein [Natrinema pallidum]|uniref:NAD operon protein n=2 Tax=Natrinema pallidum TaxID=69527 RepID=L9YKZ9_9EURY|nr:SAM-dependent chlorinase/fluorinase [Natrinema pallidum]ELY74809.1 NAD operon protein [Natrinema pallidum DSM 3751]QCW04411.1 SAM-dependent chlorinase/fluorinase [Natrinema pallidum]
MITLASDFGTPYPAAMKGVLGQRTDARLVDVAHDFPRQDVRTAAFWLREVLPYFPPATHLVVIDPGVGTERAALVLRAGDHTLVGPDNGVLCPAARRLAGGDDGELEAYVIAEDELDTVEPTIPSQPSEHRSPRSNTFHGRDVFAPAAAAVHDVESDALGSLTCLESGAVAVDLELPTADLEGHRAIGEVMVVDGFGNAITNVPGSFLDGRARVLVNGDAVPVGETFAAVSMGARLATVGSHGYVELDVNRGRGEDAFGLAPGDRVVLEASS